jgi:uncharacterized protein (DUF2336 family)
MSNKQTAAEAIARRQGISLAAALALVDSMGDETVAAVLAAEASRQRPDLAVQAVLDAHADTLRPPVETEVPQVLRKDGTWGDKLAPEQVDAAAFGARVSPEIPPLE